MSLFAFLLMIVSYAALLEWMFYRSGMNRHD